MNKLLYRASEARAAIGCGVTKFYELINNGTLDARRFGKRTYVTGQSLEKFVEALKPVITQTMAKAEREAQAGNSDRQPLEAEQSPRSRFASAAPRPE